jgi:hypothetical protein
MFDYMSKKVRKDFMCSQIKMINTEYNYNELQNFNLCQLESIRNLLLAGFAKDKIEENKLYNWSEIAINKIIQINIFDKKFNLHEELKKNE